MTWKKLLTLEYSDDILKKSLLSDRQELLNELIIRTILNKDVAPAPQRIQRS